jgi:hypothetical protein
LINGRFIPRLYSLSFQLEERENRGRLCVLRIG